MPGPALLPVLTTVAGIAPAWVGVGLSVVPVAPIVGGAILGATGSMPLPIALAAGIQVVAGVGAWITAPRRAPAGRLVASEGA